MRAYVTGGTGFVGSNIVKRFVDLGATVRCPVHRFVPEGELAYEIERVDLLDAERVAASVATFSPDVIVHSMILNDFDLMYRDRTLAWRSYVGTTEALAHAANASQAKLVLVSTDWVFDGTQSGADEDTPPNPINYYGVLKVASEQVALHLAHEGSVARVSGVNGTHWVRPTTLRAQDCGFGYFVASIVDALSAGHPFTVWEGDDINMVATPSLASACADVMWRISTIPGATGIFHCCGSESIDRMSLARLACDVFELDPDLLHSGPADPSAMPGVPIPYDTSLSVRRTSDVLGYEPQPARTLLERFRLEMQTGRLETGSP